MDKFFTVEVLAQTPNPQQLIYAAMHQDYAENFVWAERDRFPDEEACGDIIIKQLLAGNRGHYGPLEHPQITLNCGFFPHSTMQQMRTHRVSVSFDVQCLSADAEITFVNNVGHSSLKLKKTMGDLYDLWHNGEKTIRHRAIRGRNGETPGGYRRDAKDRLKKMRVRSLDEENNTFTANHIQDVVFNGLNPVYRVTLSDGKALKCTQNHKIFTPYGWRILGQLGVGSQVMINGQTLKNAGRIYQNKKWLKAQFAKGLIPKDIAALVGCSVEAVKKWAYRHELMWEKKQWNKGTRYTIEISEQERDRRRQHGRAVTARRVEAGTIPSGPDHGAWKLDLPAEKRVYNRLKYQRERIILEKGGVCTKCGSEKNIHVHHVQEVRNRPDLAFDELNMTLLCSKCHAAHHHTGTSNPLCAHPVEIISIEYVGVEPTYDLVMSAPHHNFVADGIVVHNSFRYSGNRLIEAANGDRDIEEVFYLRPVGEYSDRQGKHYEYTNGRRLEDIRRCMDAALHYAERINEGFSEEHARSTILFDARQHWVMSANVRSLMHLLDLRWKLDAQLEAQQLCELMWEPFKAWVPAIADWYESNRLHKARLSP